MTCAGCEKCLFEEPQESLIYEIHITVDNLESFSDNCYEIGVKPIIIDLGENIPTQVMTSSTVRGSDASALAMASHLSSIFKDRGYNVIRAKIETVPWHPKAACPDPNQYFECHFGVKLPCDETQLKFWAKTFNLHYSRNAMKQDHQKVQMLTYRLHGQRDMFEEHVGKIKKYLEMSGFELEKVITEFALYDTNVELDRQWLS